MAVGEIIPSYPAALPAGIIHPMSPKITFRPFILPNLILLLLGWGGLYYLAAYTLPTVWPRWGFFALWTVALTATAFPVVYLIGVYFSSERVEPKTLVRRALWVGVFGATLAWLQLARLVNVYVILGLAFGLIAVESLLRLRERARWVAPKMEDDDEPA